MYIDSGYFLPELEGITEIIYKLPGVYRISVQGFREKTGTIRIFSKILPFCRAYPCMREKIFVGQT